MSRQPLVLEHAQGSATGAQSTLTFIGTATVLVRHGGFTFLTDPNFLHAGERAYLGKGLWSKRLTEPAMSIDQLPPLDFLVLSHHHGDHFDRVAAAGLDKDLPIITEPHGARKLERQGFRHVIALRTWESQMITQGSQAVEVTSLPGRHAPGPVQAMIPPVMGSLLAFSDAGRTTFRLYVTGDTLVFDGLREIRQRHPDIDVCLLHLGGTRVAGVLLTMDAAQGVEALRIVAPRAAVPIHFDDYTVFKSPLDDFRAAMARSGLPTHVRYVDRGQTIELASGGD